MQIDSLTEELAAMRLQMQQMKSIPIPLPEREEKEQQTSSEKGDDDDVQQQPSIFPMSEIVMMQTCAHNTQKEFAETTIKAEEWVRELKGDRLKPMAKAMGRVVAASNYGGEPYPIAFAAWCDSIWSLMPIYDIPSGPSQVQAATWFLTGVAQDWWTGVCAIRGYRCMRTLEEFFQALEEQFQPSDAIEQVMVKWVILKQTNTVTIYMNEVDALHNTWALGE